MPSDSRVPSALRSKGRMDPLGLSARSWVKTLHSVAMWQWCTAPATTASQRPAASSPTAWSTASREEAQAASSV